MSATHNRSGAGGAKPALNQVFRQAGRAVGDRGPLDLAPDRAVQTEAAHQPFDRAAGDRDTFTVELQPHLPGAVDAVVRGVHPGNVGLKLLVADLAPARRTAEPATVVVVSGRGDRQAVLGQHGANRLDAPDQATRVAVALVGADELHDQWCGRSSSAAKKVDAALRMPFARFNSAFSRRSRFNSTDSSVVAPGRWPASTSR